MPSITVQYQDKETLEVSEPVVKPKRRGRRFLWLSLALAMMMLLILQWGGYLLVSEDPLPPRADAAIVLQGSVLGERARLGGAVRLLESGVVRRILLSIPNESYWGQAITPMAQSYIAETYGARAAESTILCATGADVDSTVEEAKVLAACAQEQDFHSIVLVTSDYHTRRAGIIWRHVLRAQHSTFQFSVHAVEDPEFHKALWWRERRSAKTWFMESIKLVETVTLGCMIAIPTLWTQR